MRPVVESMVIMQLCLCGIDAIGTGTEEPWTICHGYGAMGHHQENYGIHHDDVIKWKHFPRYWPFVRGIHRSPLNSPHKGQWRGALMFLCSAPWINGWLNNHEACDLKRHRTNYDVTVVLYWLFVEQIIRFQSPMDSLRKETVTCFHVMTPSWYSAHGIRVCCCLIARPRYPYCLVQICGISSISATQRRYHRLALNYQFHR